MKPSQIFSRTRGTCRCCCSSMVTAAGGNFDAAIDANARIHASLLSEASPVIAGAIKEGKLRVVPARYDIANGKVSLLV